MQLRESSRVFVAAPCAIFKNRLVLKAPVWSPLRGGGLLPVRKIETGALEANAGDQRLATRHARAVGGDIPNSPDAKPEPMAQKASIGSVAMTANRIARHREHDSLIRSRFR